MNANGSEKPGKGKLLSLATAALLAGSLLGGCSTDGHHDHDSCRGANGCNGHDGCPGKDGCDGKDGCPSKDGCPGK